MRSIAVLLIFFLSCGNESNRRDNVQTFQEGALSKIESESKLLQELESVEFKGAGHFLIEPKEVVEEIFIKPHWWSYWKEHLNYREEQMPRGVISYVGDPEDDYAYGRTTKWKDCVMMQLEQLSFSESGQLLTLVDTDSSIYQYDGNDRLRQINVFSDSNSDDISSIRLFDYDDHGNILSNAVFFKNGEELYLNHFNAYSYFESDSGFYMKEEFYSVDPGVLSSGPHSTSYFLFNNEHLLLKGYQIFSQGTRAVSFYDYETFEGQPFLKSKVTRNLHNWSNRILEITERDHLNRVTLTKYDGGSIQLKDSMVFYENKKKHFNYTSDVYDDLVIQEFDAFNNEIHDEFYEFKNLDSLFIRRQSKTKYELLEEGTWYSAITQSMPIDSLDDYDWTEFRYRKFLSQPVEPNNWTYKESPDLLKLIEECIPEEKR